MPQRTLSHLSICSGIGGLDLAAELAGFRTVGQVEIADYPFRVLRRRFGRIPRWRDIHDVTGDDIIRRCGVPTLITGGFPCQPHSVAGRRQASRDKRDLWPELRRVLREVMPRWFVAENVQGLLSSETGRFFGGILRDLAKMGYTAGWGCWGAEHVGAPHPRHRVFLLAYSDRGVGPVRWETGGVRGVAQSPLQTAEGRHAARARRRANGNDLALEEFRLSSYPDWWAREPRLGRVVHGVSGRMDESVRKRRVRALGNAVVPAQVHILLEEIAAAEVTA